MTHRGTETRRSPVKVKTIIPMKMGIRVHILLSVIFSLFVSLPLWSIYAFGDNVPPNTSPVIQAPTTGNEKENQEKSYWCKRVAYYKKRIDQAEYEVNKKEEVLSDLRDSASKETGNDKKYLHTKIKKTEKNLAGAHKVLKERKQDLSRIEDEAQKKNIPPEWLKCE